MTIPKTLPAYHTYLLTLWEERSGKPTAGSVWRFRLEDPHSGKKYLFVSLADMVKFLETTCHSEKP